MDDPPQLEVLPATFASTVAALHLVAEQLVAPARKPDNEIALQPTPGGFGTPVFDHDGVRHQVRVEDAELVHEEDGTERRAPLSSLAVATEAVEELLPSGMEPSTEPLAVDAEASRALGAFYAFSGAALAQLDAEAEQADAATPARLWPEHFDLAIELGDEAAGGRANYGASPGDENHAEPYLYVGPWTAEVAGELWRASGFSGAELGYTQLLAAADQGGAALDFFRERKKALAGIARSDT